MNSLVEPLTPSHPLSLMPLWIANRRDKYEPDLKEYWVDTETSGSFENEREETFVDRTSAEGDAVNFELGIPGTDDPLVFDPREGEEGDGDEDDDDVGSSVSKTRPDCERESAFEAMMFMIFKLL